jgi:hypothetical protein
MIDFIVKQREVYTPSTAPFMGRPAFHPAAIQAKVGVLHGYK